MEELIGTESASLFQCIEENKAPVSIRLNPLKNIASPEGSFQVPWNKNGFYLDERPNFTADPLFHAGAYYVQEASSMFLDEVITQHLDLDKPLVVLDLCAAPGGKSTLLSARLKDEDILISNEINKTRADVLTENIQKWGLPNVIVTRNAPSDFTDLNDLFDCIVVDAPCSGEGMFRKTPHAIDEWSPENVQICIDRQKEILEDIWPSLKPGGLLIYSTCTFNLGENEEQVQWLMDEFEAENLPINTSSFPSISASLVKGIHAARFFPHLNKGEGLFMTALRKAEEIPGRIRPVKNQIKELDKKLNPKVSGFLKPGHWSFFEHRNQIFATLPKMTEVVARISNSLYPLHFGVALGELKGSDLIPAPGLAFSTMLNRNEINISEVSREQALALLSKETPAIEAKNGWVLCTYQNLGLVWVKAVGQRINNYYPKEWRIRSDYRNFE